MERKTRNEKRKDQDRVATSDFARVLRRRSSICSLIVVIFAGAVFSSVGCSSWRSTGRVDSPRGEYFLEDKDSEEIWRSSATKDVSDNLNIRGGEAEIYGTSSELNSKNKKTGVSLTERFTHMFRKPSYSPSDLDRQYSRENSELGDASKYIKNDASLPKSHASLSGKATRSDAPKESFWSKIFGTSHGVPKEDEFKSNQSVETRAGGLARDDVENKLNQNASQERQPRQVYVRKRWTSRQTQNEGTTVAVNPRVNSDLGVVAQSRNNVKSDVVAQSQNDVKTAVVTKTRNDFGALLLRQYDSQRFLPPFDVIEQYYYPSGISVETPPRNESDSSFANSNGTVLNDVGSGGQYRSCAYSPVDPSKVDESVSQVAFYQIRTSDSAYARTPDAQVQNFNAENTRSQESSLLERRQEFSWFDDSPSSLTPEEQAKDSISKSPLEGVENAIESSERYENNTAGIRSADEILDEAAQREKSSDVLGKSKSVSYEASTNEPKSMPNASTINDDVFGTAEPTSNFDVSSLVGQTDELNGAVAAINLIDERKSANASAPLTNEEIEWVKHVEEAIQGLLTERAELKKRGESTTLCDARLRLLFLVVGEYDRQIQAINDVYDPLKLFWERECDGLEKLLQNELEEIDPVFVAETLMAGLDSFFDVCDVQIRKALLVAAPACFGLFEERVKPYRPGEVVYAYAELDYVVSKETTRGHEIAVECRWRLLDSKGNALTSFQTQRCENVAETRLRDVVLNVAVPLSEEIAPNDYLLELEIVDLNARESVATTRRLPVKVVAKSGAGTRG